MRIQVFAFFLLVSTALFSQEQLGLRLENYAGVSSLALNPAGNLTNPLKWDVNLIGGGLFVENNYAFIQNTGLLDLLKTKGGTSFVLAGSLEGQAPSNAKLVDFFTNQPNRRNVTTSVFLAGPSAAFRIGERHSVGVFTHFRYHSAAQNVPYEFSYYDYSQRAFNDPFTVQPFEAALTAWSEIGLNYAFKMPSGDGDLGFGVNVRFLQAYEGAFVENLEPFSYNKLPGDTVQFDHPHGRFAYTFSNLQGNSPALQQNGGGMAFDLGVIKTFDAEGDGYRLRLGASLLDLGYLHFDKNAAAHEINPDLIALLGVNDFKKFDAPEKTDEYVKVFSQQITGDSLASYQGDAFKIALPAAFSLQADYSLTPNLFINGTWVQRIPMPGVSSRRSDLLAVAPRFEHRWFSASAPLSIYNWNRVHAGFAARLAFLVIGTDNLPSIIGQRRFTGTDFYFALKINAFDLGHHLSGMGGGSGKRRYGGKGKVKCYDF